MPSTTGAFGEIIEPGLSEVFFTDLKLAPQQSTAIFNMKSSSKHTEDDLTIGGLETMPEQNEGAAVTYGDPTQGYKKTYTHVQYGLGFAVTRVMWEDDLYGVMAEASRKLSRSAVKAYEVVAANVFNNGFDSTYAGADSLELFSTVHTLLNGETAGNEPTTACDLNLTTLESAVSAFREIKDDTGAICGVAPRYLVVPNELEFTAKRLLGSEKDPESAENAINPLYNRLNLIVWDYLTDADAWFLLAAKPEHKLKFFWRIRPTFASDDDFDTGNARFKSRMRFDCGWSDWRGVYGSPGA